MKSVNLHEPEVSANGTWDIYPLSEKGHFSPHYRAEPKVMDIDVLKSIRTIKVDFEYLNYFLKEYTNLCND